MLENITEQAITLNVKASNWEDAICKCAKPLLEAGKIEKSYIDAMIDAVHRIGPYIVLGNHVALAHARPECGVNEMAVHFSTLEPPICFGSDKFDPVSLVITLAAVDADSHLELISELATVLMDPENIDYLVASKTSSEFLGLLNKLKDVE